MRTTTKPTYKPEPWFVAAVDQALALWRDTK